MLDAGTSRRPAHAAAPAPDTLADRVRHGLRLIDSHGVPYCLRNGRLAFVAGDDIDVLVNRKDLRSIGGILAAAGWSEVKAPGHWGHRFWVTHVPEVGWAKLDLAWVTRYGRSWRSAGAALAERAQVDGVWIAGKATSEFHRRQRERQRREVPCLIEKALRRVPNSARRSGVVIAVLGPDGAGKSSLVEAARTQLPIASSSVYLGYRRRAAHVDSALEGDAGPSVPDRSRPARSPRGAPPREVAFVVGKWLRLVPKLASAYWSAWCGHVVFCDRPPLDALAVRPERSRLASSIESALVRRATPRPDAVVVLDAPGDVLYARKGEHSVDVLERWRAGYRGLGPSMVIDTTGDRAAGVRALNEVVWRSLARQRGWRD